MEPYDLIILSQSEVVNYEEYSKLPLERLPLFRELIYPRMIRFKGGFHSHLDVLNYLATGEFWAEAPASKRRELMSIWNLPGFSGIHLANYLSSYNLNTYIVNNIDAEWDRFIEACSHAGPQPLVGLSTTFHLSYSEISRLVRAIRKIVPQAAFVLGGAFINNRAEVDGMLPLAKTMRKLGIDYVLHGFNSEQDLRDLLLSRRSGEGGEKVLNLARLDKQTGEVHSSDQVWHAAELHKIPPAWDKLDLPFVNHTLQMRTSSGCPFHCAFCSYPETAKGFHTMPPEEVLEHVKSALRVPGVDKVIFIDDTFNVPQPRFKELLRGFAPLGFEWFSFLRAQFVDDETARLMRDSGCRAVYLGVESANNAVLKQMNKKATREEYTRGIAALKKAGIATLAAFVLGFPGETSQTIADDAAFIRETGVDFYTLKEFYYLDNTKVHRERELHGLTGKGNTWSHRSMDSQTAYQHKIQLFLEIQESVFVDPDTSLWHIAYLYDKGFSLAEIASLQRELNAIMAAQIGGDFDETHPAFSRLAEQVRQGRNS